MVHSLPFRRQFLVTTSNAASAIENFEERSFYEFKVYSHPELDVTFFATDDRKTKLMLFGFIVDSDSVEKTNSDILADISRVDISVDSLASSLKKYSGRFVLFISNEYCQYVLNDPCGLRSLFYKKHGEDLFFGSSTEILKMVTTVEKGEKYNSYASSRYVAQNIEHWLPSGCSLYEDVESLVPNHVLNLADLKQIRYWPYRPIETIEQKQGVLLVSKIMKNLIAAADSRFKLSIPMTAGWDSRLIFSLSRNFSKKVFLYTLKYRNLDKKSNDIVIPRKLLSYLGLRHQVLDCKSVQPDSNFIATYEKNTQPSHFNDWGQIAFGILKLHPQDVVCLKGNCSEIARCYYYPTGEHSAVENYKDIVALEKGWSEIPFIEKRISEWFDATYEVALKNNISILDLFYWEHRMGSWQAQSQLEWDIAQETFTPYNHRELLETMLSVPASARRAPDYELYKDVINLNWQDVLKYPINPPENMTVLKTILFNLGIYEWVKNLRDNLTSIKKEILGFQDPSNISKNINDF